mgnify:CR=1 FL=1
MFRLRIDLPLVLIGLLTTANLAVLAGRAVAVGDRHESEQWQRWRALPTEQRWELIRRYQELLRQTDLATAWRHAQQFRELPPIRQNYLRELYEVMRETLDRQPVSRRRELLRAAPRARAFYLYQILVSEEPARLAELATRRPA